MKTSVPASNQAQTEPVRQDRVDRTKQERTDSAPSFVDARPAVLAQRRREDVANQSARATQLKGVADLIDSSPRTTHAQALVKMTNSAGGAIQAKRSYLNGGKNHMD